MNLYSTVTNSKRRLAVPLAGFPGVKLIGKTIKETISSAPLHVDALTALVDEVKPDGVFTIMDLTLEAEALGIAIRMPDNEAPSVAEHPIKTMADFKRLPPIDPRRSGRMPVYLDAVAALSTLLPIPVGGYVIGPFTLACELCGAQEFSEKTILDKPFVEAMLDFTVDVSRLYAMGLVASGAKMIAMLEPSAMFLSAKMFNTFLKARIGSVMSAVAAGGAAPILHICGNTMHLVPSMAETGAQGLSLDAPVDFKAAAAKIPSDIVLIGNIDPVAVMMQGTREQVADAAKKLLDEMKPFPNFILGSGCDLPPETPVANIAALVGTVK